MCKDPVARPDKELLWLRQREQEGVQGEIKVKSSSGVKPHRDGGFGFWQWMGSRCLAGHDAF